MPRVKTPISTEAPVAPVESVETETVKSEPVPVTDRCWNCYNQGQENQLEDGKCAVCGFDKNLIYNLELEEQRARQVNAK